ncbi:glycosyltransferase family 2 protein [Tractidigestivibacter sp.]|uniref:glycosyltransferase family 2 protein n=1 Tax=Tractidigestivibacter sp. TaxID=2847320 RepID=UPI002A91A906|nr:glycosyltransferase [Tractidigestivibacter sp.]MDD7585192.1 glycosyltransferase [Coriobacteriaceae bacterium]MDY5271841.1 glycosyltransferase [Tractidigestivibacter sp.]
MSDAKHPLVSVVVPIYNVERYLERCLSSLAAQTFDDFEVICVNDGSTDASAGIARGFADRDGRFVLVDKSNSGYGASMNVGLDRAQGRYVAILESDDFFDPQALELLVLAAEAASAEVAKGNFWLYWSGPNERRVPFPVVDAPLVGRTTCPRRDADVAIFFRKSSIWSGIYRRDFLERNGIRFLETPGASYQDVGFNFKVWAAANRATFVADCVLCYRQDNEASSVKSGAKAYCVCDEYQAMTEYVRERFSPPDTTKLMGILERMKLDSYLWNYDRLDPGLRPAFVERISREMAEDVAAGRVDRSLFEPGAAADLDALVSDPKRFERSRRAYGAPGGAVLRYLALGGVPLLADALRFKALGHSVRRTNQEGAAL